MDRSATYRTTMQYALAIVGSELTLAVRLRVPVEQLKNWLNGTSEIPDRVFLEAVDVVIAATRQDIARTRETLRNAPKLTE